MIIRNVQVDHVTLRERFGFSLVEIVENLVVNTLLAAQDYVEDVVVELELLGMIFDFTVSVQHVQHSILTVDVAVLNKLNSESVTKRGPKFLITHVFPAISFTVAG